MRALLIFSLLLCFRVHAESSPSYEQVLTELQSVQSLRAHFIQEKKVQALAKPLRSEGKFLYRAGNGILWRTEKPFASSFSISEKGISKETALGKESVLVKDNPALARITDLFLSLFRAQRYELEQNFATQFETEGMRWKLILIPKDTMAATVIRDLTLRGQDTVQSITLTEKSGDFTTISFSDTVKNPTFTADEGKGFE